MGLKFLPLPVLSVLFVELICCFFVTSGNAEQATPNNTSRESSITSAHYRRQSEVKFGNWAEPENSLRARVDVGKIRKRLESDHAATVRAQEKFHQLPPLYQCTESKTFLRKKQFSQKSVGENFHPHFFQN